MVEQFLEALQDGEQFLLLPHLHMDGDAFGSCMALKRLLERLGKQATVCTEEKRPSFLFFLGDDYKVYENEPIACDTVICVDCGDIERLGARGALIADKPVLCIDHHVTNTGFAKVNWIEPEAAATGELVYQLYQQAGIAPDPEVATCLYTAILTDTGGFQYSNTTPKTLEYAADLMRCGANSSQIATWIYDTQSLAKLRLTAKTLSSLQMFEDGKIAVMVTTQQDLQDCGASGEDTEGFSSIARGIEGVEVGIFVRELKSGLLKVSMRSKSYVDVTAVVNVFGGGGHVRAAGCTCDMPFDELIAALVTETKKQL